MIDLNYDYENQYFDDQNYYNPWSQPDNAPEPPPYEPPIYQPPPYQPPYTPPQPEPINQQPDYNAPSTPVSPPIQEAPPQSDLPNDSDEIEIFDYLFDEYEYEEDSGEDFVYDLNNYQEQFNPEPNNNSNDYYQQMQSQLYQWAINSAIENGADPRDLPIPLEYRFGLEADWGMMQYENRIEINRLQTQIVTQANQTANQMTNPVARRRYVEAMQDYVNSGLTDQSALDRANRVQDMYSLSQTLGVDLFKFNPTRQNFLTNLSPASTASTSTLPAPVAINLPSGGIGNNGIQDPFIQSTIQMAASQYSPYVGLTATNINDLLNSAIKALPSDRHSIQVFQVGGDLQLSWIDSTGAHTMGFVTVRANDSNQAASIMNNITAFAGTAMNSNFRITEINGQIYGVAPHGPNAGILDSNLVETSQAIAINGNDDPPTPEMIEEFKRYIENITRQFDNPNDIKGARPFKEGGSPGHARSGHNVKPPAIAEFYKQSGVRVFSGINKWGRYVDIFYKDGTAVITEYGMKDRVITAYGKLFGDKPFKLEDVLKSNKFVEIKVGELGNEVAYPTLKRFQENDFPPSAEIQQRTGSYLNKTFVFLNIIQLGLTTYDIVKAFNDSKSVGFYYDPFFGHSVISDPVLAAKNLPEGWAMDFYYQPNDFLAQGHYVKFKVVNGKFVSNDLRYPDAELIKDENGVVKVIFGRA